ncbi:hypothetical protein GPN2_20957 [Streptomyces murinus]
MVVLGTPRDSLHILGRAAGFGWQGEPGDGGVRQPSYSDMVFGLFKILGYNFSPDARGALPRWGRCSPSTGGSPRPNTCCAWSTRSTTPTARPGLHPAQPPPGCRLGQG